MINIIILFVLIVAGVFLFNNNEESIPKNKPEVVEDIVTVKNDNKKIKVLYLDDTNSNMPKDTKVVRDKVLQKKAIEHNEINSMSSEETTKYIEENNLIDVTAHNTNEKHSVPPRFSVYSDISQEDAKTTRDQNLPPMAPVIASGVFRSGQTYTVIIPAAIKESANQIIVTDNAPDGTPQEAIEIPTQNNIDNQEESSQETQEAFTISPPSIGQN